MEKLNRTIQVTYYKLRRLHWQAQIGLLLIVTGLLLLLTVTSPKAHALKALNADITELKNSHQASTFQENINPEIDIAEQFYALLPAQKEVNIKIAQILQIASDNGLQVKKVEYTTQSTASAALLKYQIKLPLTGTYLQIRQFVTHTLNAQPSLALSDINFKRDDIGADLVKSNILFTLYLKQEKS